MSDEFVPVGKHAAQLKPLDGQRVRLIGIYLPVPTLKKMPRPGKPREEVDLGEVVIQLEGSASAYDPAAAENTPARIALGTAFRPSGEIHRYGNCRVSVEGRLVLTPDGNPASKGATTRPTPVLYNPTDLRIAE